MSCFVTTHPVSDIDKLWRAISLLARVAGQDLHTFVNSMDIRKGPSHGPRKSFFIE